MKAIRLIIDEIRKSAEYLKGRDAALGKAAIAALLNVLTASDELTYEEAKEILTYVDGLRFHETIPVAHQSFTTIWDCSSLLRKRCVDYEVNHRW